MIIIYCPCPTLAISKDIARRLLKDKMIACANIIPSSSLYLWEGKLKEEKEHILLVKTAEGQEAGVKTAIAATHPYELPAIITIPVSANEPFDMWVYRETENN